MKKKIIAVALACAAFAAVARAETGVSDGEIVLGQAAAFSGPSAGLGTEMWRGATAAFQAANDAGGVHGRKVRLVVADDGYDAEQAAPAVVKLIAKEKVFCLFGGVGTPTIVKALPVVLKFHQKEGLFYFANFTGAQPQREPPYDACVFNVRASYRQETKAAVDAFVGMNRKRIAIFVQDDAFGTSGRDGVKRALKDHGLEMVVDTTYPRGQKFDETTDAQVKLVKDARADAVVCVGAYQACAGFVRDARRAGLDCPIHDVSFVGADQMLSLLKAESKKSGGDLLKNLLVTQVVPSYDDASLPLVKEYRAAMEKYKPGKAPAGDGSYEPTALASFGSLEGFVSAKAFLLVLDKAGKSLDRKAFFAAAESLGKVDLGLGAPGEFSASRHQLLDKVWFTYATEEGWKSTDNPASVIK